MGEDKKSIEFVQPNEIEARSFAIIREELEEQGVMVLPELEFIIYRAIHTSADFDYAKTLYFSEGVLEQARKLLQCGTTIVTDTNMALSGINKNALQQLGCRAVCFMADPEVAEEAKARGITRAAVSMERAATLGDNLIFAIGNAPTALVQLYQMNREKKIKPGLIIGVPVGFVNVEAAKEMIMETEIPCIINRGRKGGSNIAAALCNALLYQLTR